MVLDAKIVNFIINVLELFIGVFLGLMGKMWYDDYQYRNMIKKITDEVKSELRGQYSHTVNWFNERTRANIFDRAHARLHPMFTIDLYKEPLWRWSRENNGHIPDVYLLRNEINYYLSEYYKDSELRGLIDDWMRKYQKYILNVPEPFKIKGEICHIE